MGVLRNDRPRLTIRTMERTTYCVRRERRSGSATTTSSRRRNNGAPTVENMARFARLEGFGEPAIEVRALPVDRTLRPYVELHEETLTDKSTQLVAVVIA